MKNKEIKSVLKIEIRETRKAKLTTGLKEYIVIITDNTGNKEKYSISALELKLLKTQLFQHTKNRIKFHKELLIKKRAPKTIREKKVLKQRLDPGTKTESAYKPGTFTTSCDPGTVITSNESESAHVTKASIEDHKDTDANEE